MILRGREAFVYEADPELELFACAKGGRRGYLLGPGLTTSPGGANGVSEITVAGPVVAYEKIFEGPEIVDGSDFVLVRNLVTGRLLHRVPAGDGAVDKIVVKPDGAVAWISGSSGARTLKFGVWAADKSGVHLLDEGGGIEEHSLRLHGSTLSWLDNGVQKTAMLQ